MKFRKGRSGNPAGRKRGAANKTTRAFKEAVMLVFEEMGGAKSLLEWATGNPGDFYRLASRLVPPGMPVRIEGLEGSLATQGGAVIRAMSGGEITPEQASTIMTAIAAQARIIEVDALEKRVKALEEKTTEEKQKHVKH